MHFPTRLPACTWQAWGGALLISGALAGPAAWAQAQPSTPPAPDPGQASTPVPALVYRSALQAYRPWREQGPGDWRGLNEQVNRIGGWRAYLREAQQAPAAPAADALLPGQAPHLATNPAAPLPERPASTSGTAPSAPPASTASPAASPARKAPHHGHH